MQANLYYIKKFFVSAGGVLVDLPPKSSQWGKSHLTTRSSRQQIARLWTLMPGGHTVCDRCKQFLGFNVPSTAMGHLRMKVWTELYVQQNRHKEEALRGIKGHVHRRLFQSATLTLRQPSNFPVKKKKMKLGVEAYFHSNIADFITVTGSTGMHLFLSFGEPLGYCNKNVTFFSVCLSITSGLLG